MASSNRHWPSMFKSKPCNPHLPWQHDINPSSSLMSSGCHRTPYSSVPGCEERTPEPKPRWNPKPEQIRILEAIFNSGMVNPPREEIRKIRAQLQEYGQVGDANVFYWFQNRKSRSKHKLRHLQNSSKNQQQPPPNTSLAPTSSSSSSEKSSPDFGSKRITKSTLSLSSPGHVLDSSHSPTGSVTQNMYLQPQNDFLAEPFFFQPVNHQSESSGGGLGASAPQEFCFSDISNLVQVHDNTSLGPCTSLLLSEIINPNPRKKVDHNYHHLEEKSLMMMTNKMEPHQLGYFNTVTQPIPHTVGLAPHFSNTSPTSTEVLNSVAFTSTINPIHQGRDEVCSGGAAVRSTVFINDVAFEVAVGPFNVREAFGDDLLLVHSSGQPVLTDEWGLSLQSLQHGALYYLVPLSMSQHI